MFIDVYKPTTNSRVKQKNVKEAEKQSVSVLTRQRSRQELCTSAGQSVNERVTTRARVYYIVSKILLTSNSCKCLNIYK